MFSFATRERHGRQGVRHSSAWAKKYLRTAAVVDRRAILGAFTAVQRTPSSAPGRQTQHICLPETDNCALPTDLPDSHAGAIGTRIAIEGGAGTRMPEQNPETPDIAGLVRGAVAGDRQAWERLVEQYARLIWSITVDFRLAESDAADVAQTTWLRLLEHIHRIEYPDRVGSWLAATARNECLRSLAARKRVVLAQDDEVLSGVVASWTEVDERILADERDQVVRDAVSRLPGRWQRLLELLMADPPTSYADISDELGLPVGSIGPTRGRCLAQLRVLLQAS